MSRIDYLFEKISHATLVLAQRLEVQLSDWDPTVVLVLSFCTLSVSSLLLTCTFIPSMRSVSDGISSSFAIGCTKALHSVLVPVVTALSGWVGAKRQVDKKLPKLDKYTIINKNVCVVLGCNPGPHTLQGTNTYLIGRNENLNISSNVVEKDGGKILVDTGEGSTSKEYVQLLLDEVFPATNTKYLTKVLLTHYHYDHIGGVNHLMEELTRRGMLPLPTIHKQSCEVYGGEDIRRTSPQQSVLKIGKWAYEPIRNRQIFRVLGSGGDLNIVAIFTPGHTADHTAFVIKEECALLSGDCILGCSSSVFDNLAVYMDSLHHLRYLVLKGLEIEGDDNEREDCESAHGEIITCGKCSDRNSSRDNSNRDGNIRHIYPGHGPILLNCALDTVNEYIHHRVMREQQIVAVLSQQSARARGDGWHTAFLSSWQIMRKIYQKPLPVTLKLSAQRNVLHHLHKLEGDGIVMNSGRINCGHGLFHGFPVDIDLWKLVQ